MLTTTTTNDTTSTTQTFKVYKKKQYLKCNGLTASLGNKKLDSSILIFNLPAVKTCPVCRDCKKKCYALKFEKLYPSVKICRQNNLDVLKDGPFIGSMLAIIERAKTLGVTAVRVHESGDFFNQDYANIWTSIAAAHTDLIFFAYTKSPYRPKGNNWNIVESILPDGSINFGTPEYVHEKLEKYGYPICPATDHTLAATTTCGKNCKLCQYTDHVLFLVH